MKRKRLQWDPHIKSIPKNVFILSAALFMNINMMGENLVTNTSQSASWVRLPARNASLGIDAVYYNPAGVMKLENGYHISFSNQSVFQKREIDNSYSGPDGAFGLNENVYRGTSAALVFPAIYAVYKIDKIAFSFGFNPIGGNGSSEYKKGLPSLEVYQSDLVPLMATSHGASEYSMNAYFKESSIFLGFQGGVAYKINDWLSVSGGLRYVIAKNKTEGHVTDIELKLASGWTRADAIMKQIADGATASAEVTTAFIGYGLGTLTFAQVPTDYISSADRTKLEDALIAIGSPATVIIETADLLFKKAAANFGANASLLGDQAFEAKQSGMGITPFFSVNLSPSENLNIGIRYEMATKLELTDSTNKDLLLGYEVDGTPVTMFPNGDKTRNDMPAMLAIGVDYRISESLKLSLGSNYFFDRTADYGHKVDADLNYATPIIHIENKDIIDRNGFSLQAGLEYNISEKLLVSGGYVWANKGVNAKYQSDLTYGLATQTFGLGGAYNINKKVQINIGGGYTMYKDDTKVVDHIFSGTGANITANETYRKNTIMIAVGVDFRF